MFGGRVMEQEMFFVPNTPAKSGSAGSGLNPKDRIFGDWETSFGCAGVPREEFGAGECSGGLGMKIGFGGGENLGNCGVEDFVADAENMSFTELLGIAGCGAPTGEGATQKKHSGGVPDGNGISVPPTPMEKEQISRKKRQQKVVRKKHRPKIFDESKPKRTPKAKPKRETEKRKTARKSSTGQPPGSAIRSGVILETSTPNPQTPKPLVAKRKRKGTTIKASKKILKSCKRGIDFSSESSIGEQNIADVETVSTIAEELRNQVSDCSSELYANSSHYVDHKAAGSEMKCTVNSPVHSLSLKLEDKTANIYATNVTRAENDLYEKRLTVGNNSVIPLVGSLDNTCKQTFDCAEEARMESDLSSKPLESSLNQNGGKEMMGVINHNGCRSNSLQVYQRRFRANEPIKNIRKLGPNCPKPYKGMRTKRKKRTVMYNLWFLEEVSEQKVIAPRYALRSNFKQRSDDPKLSVLPTKSQIEASMIDQESFKCSLSLFAIVKSKRKRSKRKRSKKISNVDSFPHVSTKRKRSNLMPKQCLPSSNTITHNSHNNLTSVSETLSIRRTVALNLEACAEIPVYPPQRSQAKVEKLHPPPPPCPGMSLQEYLYPTAQGSQSKLTCHLLSQDSKYIGWHPKEAFIPTTSKHIEWHRKEAFTPTSSMLIERHPKEAFTPTSSMLIERHPKEAFTPTTKSLHAKVDKLHSSPLGSSLQDYQRLWPIVQSTSCRTSKPFTADSQSKFRVSTHHLQDSSHEKVKLSIHPPHLCSSSQGSSKTKVETRRLRHRNTLSDIEFRQQDCFPIAQGSLVKFTKSLESNIQQLEKLLEKLQISDEYGQLVVRDTNIHGAVTPYKDKSDPPKRRKLPKVDLDSESIRRWNMLMETDASELPEDVDEEKKKDWDEQEKVFHKRLEGFITFMHVLQGDRRFSPWKGSVVDSVVGVFLTQNVSDYLSSNAFMSLAAKYPAPSRCFESDVNYLCSQESTIGPNSQHSHETFIYSRERENEVVVEHPSTFENSTALKERLEFEQTDNSDGLPQEVELPSCGSSDDTRLCDCENGIITPSTEILEDPNRADISLSLSASVHNGCISSLDGNLGFGCDFGEDKNKNSDTSEDVNKNYGSKNGCARVSSMLEEVAKVSANSNTSLNELEVAMEDTVLLNNTYLEENTSFGSNNGCASKSGVLDEVANASGNSNTSLNELEVTREDIVLLNNTYLEENTPSGSENGCTSISGVLEEAAKGSANSNTSLNELQVAMEDNTVPLNNTHPEENTSSDSKNGCASISGMLEEVAKASSNSNTLLNELVAPEDNTVSLNNTHQQENMSPRSREKRSKVTKTPIPEAEWEELRKTYYNPNRTPGKNLDSIDWDAVRCAPVGEIAKVIETRGMNNVLAAKIKAFLNRLAEHHDSIDLEWLKDVPPEKAKEFLLSIRGVGLKSTECVRLLTLGHHAFPVDTNIARIVVRLGWVPLEPLPGDLQIHLLEQYPQMDAIQKYLWPRLCTLDKNILYVLHYQLITFGKVICTKKNPNCNACPMRAECRHFASAFASSRLRLRGAPEKRVATTQGQARDYGVSKSHMRPSQPVLPHIERDIEDFPYGFTDKDDKRCTQTREPAIEMRDIEDFPFELDNKDEKSYTQTCEPIIEVPASPEPESTVSLEIDADIIPDESKDEDEIPHIKLDTEEFKRNLLKYLNPEFEVEEVSNALVALTPKATTIPAPKIKSVERLRTRHRVYTLPDSHPLLAGFEPREYDDPCPYLLAIWPKESLNRKESSSHSFVPCDGDIDSPGNASQETTNQTVCGTILIPCRTANKGSFPLNGTYFQVNEVFADHETSECPINVPRKWIWSLAQRNLYCGSTASAIARGMEMDEIQQCFWNGFVCVRAFDRKTRDPVHISKRFHELPSSVVGKKKVLNDE